MDFAPFGMTLSDWAGMIAILGALLVVTKKLIIPWVRQEIENSIASDRGIKVAIQEALTGEIATLSSLERSVVDLTTEMRGYNQSFAELRQFVNDFSDLIRGEMREVQRRLDDVENRERGLATRRPADG